MPDSWAPVAAHVPGCSGTGFCPDCFFFFSLPVRSEIFLTHCLVLEVKQSCDEENGRGLVHILI